MSIINPNKPSKVPITPTSSFYWPIANTSNFKVPSGNSGRSIGARRDNGARTHAGIDLFAKYKDSVLAITDGVIVSFYHFYRGTFCLFINHGSFTVNYGEVDSSSLENFNLKTPKYKPQNSRTMYTVKSRNADRYPVLAASGSSVSAGQPIAYVGKMHKSSMLHIEFYESGVTSNKRWTSSLPPSGLLDGTDFLETLARNHSTELPKEVVSTTVCQ